MISSIFTRGSLSIVSALQRTLRRSGARCLVHSPPGSSSSSLSYCAVSVTVSSSPSSPSWLKKLPTSTPRSPEAEASAWSFRSLPTTSSLWSPPSHHNRGSLTVLGRNSWSFEPDPPLRGTAYAGRWIRTGITVINDHFWRECRSTRLSSEASIA